MHKKASRIISALLATTALGVGLLELDANLSARAELRRILTTNPSVSVAAIYAEPLTGRLFLRGIHLAAGATRVSIGALDVPLAKPASLFIGAAQASPFEDKSEDSKPGGGAADEPAAEPEAPATPPSGGGPASDASPPAPTAPPTPTTPATATTPAVSTAAVPGTTSADDVVITRGATAYRIKHIELVGSPLSNADLAAILDTKSAESIESRLRRITATAITVPDIQVDNASGDTQGHLVLTQVVLAGATGGKVVSGTIGATTFKQKATGADPDGRKTFEWTTGPIVGTGVDFAQIARLFEATRTDDAEPILPLYESVTVTNVKGVPKDGRLFTIAAIKESGAKARALKAGTFPKAGATKQTDAEKAASYADLVQSVAIGSIELQDISGGDVDNKFSLSNVALNDFAGGKLGGLTVGKLDFDGPKAKVSLASIVVGPLTLPPPSVIEKGSASTSSTMIPAAVKIAVDKLAYDVDMADASKNEPSKRVAFNLAHWDLTSEGRRGELPASSTMTLTNLTFDVPPSPSSKALLDMGYHHVDLSLNATSAYDAEAQTLHVKDFSVQGVDMGTLALSIGLINVTKGVTSPDPEVAKGSALAILVKSIGVNIVNKGLAEKALARQAAADGLTVDQERMNLMDLVAVKLPASVNNSANAKLIGDALAKFINNPKTLQISIVSKGGLGAASMGMLADPGLLLDSLDVKAVADE